MRTVTAVPADAKRGAPSTASKGTVADELSGLGWRRLCLPTACSSSLPACAALPRPAIAGCSAAAACTTTGLEHRHAATKKRSKTVGRQSMQDTADTMLKSSPMKSTTNKRKLSAVVMASSAPAHAHGSRT